MSERFLKFIPSKAAMEFALKYKNAFILLLVIAERARRINGEPDGLTIGQCHLGNHKSYDMTEKEYRYAKQILVEQGLIKIVLTNRTRKKTKRRIFLNSENCENGANERANEVTTTGTLVELCSSDVWDINSEDYNHQKGDRKGDLGATEGRLKGDKQEGIRKKKKEKEEELPQTPSKIKFRELVELTQVQYDSLLAKHGQEFLNKMLDFLDSRKGSKGYKYDSDFHTMKEGGWVIKEVRKDLETQKSVNGKTKDNISYAENLCREFLEHKNGNGWRCSMHISRKYDQKGILFSNENLYITDFFVSMSDYEFQKKCEDFIETQNMRKNVDNCK